MQNPVYRSLFGSLLSLVVFVTGVPFQLWAQVQQTRTVSGSAPETGAEEEREKSLEKLLTSVLDPTRESPLDPFQMLKQTVIDERSKNNEILREKALLQDYEERIGFLERDIEALQAVGASQKAKKSEATMEAQKIQADFYIDDVQSRLAFARAELEELRSFDPRSGHSLNVDMMIDDRLRTRHYWGRRMKLLVSQGGEVITEIRQRDFTQSLSPGFSAENPLEDFRGQGEMTFIIADPGGRPLHKFFSPVEAVFFFAGYLVYVESSQLTENDHILPVRFIDLNYVRVNIGNAPLPVFTLPLKLNRKPEKFKIKNGFLKIGENLISHPQLALVSTRVGQPLFNVLVSLVDPWTYERTQSLIRQMLEFLKKSMDIQDSLFQEQFRRAIAADEYLRQFTESVERIQSVDTGQSGELVRKAFADGRISEAEYDHVKQGLFVNESLTHANQALFESRRLMTRIHLFMRFLMQPRPEGAPKVQQALLILAASSSHREQRLRSWEFVKDSPALKFVKYGTGAGVAVLGAMTFPDFFQIHIYKSVDLISAVEAHFMGYMEHIDYGRAYVHLSEDAFIRVTTGVTYIYDSYIIDHRWLKLLYGFAVIFTEILKPLAAIHIVVNSFIALKGTWNTRSLSRGQLGWLSAFYYHSREATQKYWEEKARDIEKSGGGKVSDITPSEEKLLFEYLQRLKQGRASTEDLIREIEKGRIGPESLFSAPPLKALKERLSPGGLKHILLSLLRVQQADEKRATRDYTRSEDTYHKMLAFSRNMGETYDEVAQNFPGKRIRAVREAMANTFLSYPSVIRSFKAALSMWNYVYLTHNYFYRPGQWFMFLIYPGFFKVTMNSRKGEQHFPSEYNGGLESWPRKLHRVVSRAVNNSSGFVSSLASNGGTDTGQKAEGHSPGNLLSQWMISEKGLEDLTRFESEIIKAEAEAIKLAKERAQKALMESIQDPARWQMIFDSSRKQGISSIGVSSLYDPKLKELNSRERFFYRAFFTRTFELLMQSFISEMTSTKLNNSMDPSSFAREFGRELREGGISPIDINKESIKRFRRDMEKNIDYEQVRSWAYGLAHRGEEFLKKTDIQFRMKLLQSIHPDNEQLGRVFTASKMAKNPQAMDRAVRAQISSVFSSIPMAIGSTLVLFASVQSGLLQPFDPGGMDTDTHFRYMSRYLFWTGFIPSILLGVIAGTWLKIQEDTRIGGQGGFDHVVKYSDGQKGFWRYYFKNLFRNPANNWRENQLHYLKIIWHTIPAASVTMIATNLYGLGRVDLGIFISGYVMIFATPLVGFGMQLGQAFELASAWIKSKIPGKFRAHKAAMQYVDHQIQMYKIKQSYILNFFDIIVMSGIVGELLTLADNTRYGTRAFIRLVFGGDTLAELISGLTDKMIEAFKIIPGVEPGMEAVKSIFTNKFEAWQRFPGELAEATADVERVEYDSRLPKNTLGELIGKTAAMATSWGLVTSSPYVGSHILQSINEKRLQRKASQIRCSVLFSGSF